MSEEIVVRNYSHYDLGNVKEILSDYPSPTGANWVEDRVEEMIADALKEQSDGFFIAELRGKIVGFAITIYREWFGIAYLDYIQVKREWMDRGVGHKLIEKCVVWAMKKGARIIYTETGRNNERAIRFYQKHGFSITGHIPDYYQKGLDAVILVNKLK